MEAADERDDEFPSNSPVSVSFPVHLRQDHLVVVVAHGAADFVVVHVGLVLPPSPFPGYAFRVSHAELSSCPHPTNAVFVAAVRQELQQELPQLHLAAT